MTCCQSLECVRSVRPLFEEPLTEQSMCFESRDALDEEFVLLPETERLQRWLDLNA